MKPAPQRSFYTPILLFWVLSAVPRLWFFHRITELTEAPWAVLLTVMGVGFLRDALLVGILLLCVQVLNRFLFNFSLKTAGVFFWVLVTGLGVALALLLVNVEFFRYFGASAKLENLSFIKPSGEGLFLFVSDDISWMVVFFDFVLIPVVFVYLSLKLHPFRMDFFFLQKKGKIFTLFLILLGYFAHKIPIEGEVQAKLSENAVLTFVRYLAMGDELQGEHATNFLQTMDPEPLPREGLKEPEWQFPEPEEAPLIKATPHHLCQLNRWDKLECDTLDEDGDGFVLQDDCNDLEPGINPKAKDIPRNGIDEDCSGLDADPPNFIFIHWEGARAVNVTGLGYSKEATPRFSRIVKDHGVLFRNAYANAIQTRYSLIAVYTSILPRLSSKWIYKYNPNLKLLGFPRVLKERGYETIYMHGGSISYANKGNRIKEWFETRIDKNDKPLRGREQVGWGLTDRAFFEEVYTYLKNRKDNRPFFLTAASLSLHYPFDLPEEQYALGPHEDRNNVIANIMHYSDDVLGDFLEKILKDPQFENTLVLISADHGLNYYNPHGSSGRSRLWEDVVWIPMALVGKGWNIPPGTEIDEVRQLTDIGPTILDRAGVSVPNHYVGHSLLRRFPKGREPIAFFGKPDGGLSAGLRYKNWKYYVTFDDRDHYLYDIEKDRQEKKNLAKGSNEQETLLENFFQKVSSVYLENTRLIKENKFWDWDYLL